MREASELIHQACQQIQSFNDFFQLGQDCLPVVLEVSEFIPVSSSRYQHYVIPFLQESSRYLRPINESLFMREIAEFGSRRNQFQGLIGELRDSRGNLDSLSQESREFADGDSLIRLLYTAVQLIGCILDLAPNPQTARKNFGQRFEDFVKVLLSDLGIANDAFTFSVENPAINARYNVPIDIIMNTQGVLHSSRTHIDARDTLLSIIVKHENKLTRHDGNTTLPDRRGWVTQPLRSTECPNNYGLYYKTSSKDRMKLIFVDRFVLEKILEMQRVNYVALYHNDIQRKGEEKISSTFSSDIYMVFCHVFGDLPLYYLDPPAVANEPRFQEKIKTFNTFILYDLWKL